MSAIPFIKMHGLGNDFVVIDTRERPLALDRAGAAAIADRRTGIGCDQLIVLEPSRSADVFMRIYNPDGGEAGACGNATRCVAALLRPDASRPLAIETIAGLLRAQTRPGGIVAVDMGPVRTHWREIPTGRAVDTDRADIALEMLHDPVLTNVGNPHATFFVDDVDRIPLDRLGPLLEHDPLFPERINVGVAAVAGVDRLRLRVWERGAGLTRACGTGACAALVAAHRRGLTGREAEVELDGGTLDIAWRADGHVIMTGPTAVSFEGRLDPDCLMRPARDAAAPGAHAA